MRKRFFTATLASTIAISVLAGCGSSSQGESPQGQSAEEQASGTEQSGEAEQTDDSTESSAEQTTESATESGSTSGARLKVWVPPYTGADADYTDQQFWDDEFADFEKENDCDVEVTIVPWDGMMEKMTTGITSGDGPDVLYIDTLYDLASAGALENLDPYFTDEEKSGYYYYDLGYVAGGQYCMPMVVGDATVLFCNKDIFKNAGIDQLPTTWDEMLQDALIIKEKCPDVTYPLVQSWGNKSAKSAMMTCFFPYFWSTGADFLTVDNTPNIDSSEGRETLEFLKSLEDKGVYDDTIVSVGDAPDQFRSGNAAMAMMGTGMSSSFDINWDWTSLKGPEGKEGYWISGDSLAVAANSQNKELAVKALKYMVSDKVMNAFNEKLYASAPLTKTAKDHQDETYKELYADKTEYFHIWPAFENADAFYDIFYKNIQSMYMGNMTVDEVIAQSLDEYEAEVQ